MQQAPGHLPAGLVSAGRGQHVVEPDLIAALDSGQLGGAVMDVFAQEPLPAASPLWAHPRITVTPRGGDALLFFNTLADGRADPATRHAGLPVRSGAKWLATRWIRARPLDPWNQPADAL